MQSVKKSSVSRLFLSISIKSVVYGDRTYYRPTNPVNCPVIFTLQSAVKGVNGWNISIKEEEYHLPAYHACSFLFALGKTPPLAGTGNHPHPFLVRHVEVQDEQGEVLYKEQSANELPELTAVKVKSFIDLGVEAFPKKV